MSILGFLGGIFSPAAKLVDKLHTSDAERLELRNALAQIELQVLKETSNLQAKIAEAQAKVAEAEARSESWFVRHYRPMIITSMFVLIMLQSFGILKAELPEVFWQIFAAAFGVASVAPSVMKTGGDLLKKVLKK